MRHRLLLLVFLLQATLAGAQAENGDGPKEVRPAETYESFYKGVLKDLKKFGGHVLIDKSVLPTEGAYLEQTFETTTGANGYCIAVSFWERDGAPLNYFNYGSGSGIESFKVIKGRDGFSVLFLKMANAPGRTGHIFLKKSSSCPRDECMVRLMVADY